MCSGPIFVLSRLICYENGEFRAERHLAVPLSLSAEDPTQAQDGAEQCVSVLAREHTLAAKYEQEWPACHGSVPAAMAESAVVRCPDASSHGTSDL